MKKILLKVAITSLLMALALGGVSVFLYKQSQSIQEKKNARAEQELDIILEDSSKKVYEESEITTLDLDTKEPQVDKVYYEAYTEQQNKVIKKKKKKNLYDFESPMWIWNLYGTNHLSLYTYFKTTQPASIRYTIQVEDESIPNYTRTLYNGEEGNLTREHEYQITGFVPGMDNLLILEMYDEDDIMLTQKVFRVHVPKLSSGADTKIEVESGRSEEQVSNGLYWVFGKKNILLYDNSGVLRGELPLLDASSQTLLCEEDSLYYATDKNHIVKINNLGAVKAVYNLGKYSQYDEFLYNGYGSLWVLASKDGKKSKSVKDTLLSVDLKDKTVSELFSMENLLPKMEKKAKRPKGEKTLNWVELNSVVQVNSDEVLVSSRELSSIFKIVNINSRSPRISYIIGEKKIWKGTDYARKLLAKTGQEEADAAQQAAQAESVIDLGEAEEVFYATFGQTWLDIKESSSLAEGQFYLYVWDSNYGYSPTRKNINWSDYNGVGTKNKDARLSYVRKYLVDENNAEYNLEDSQEVPYTKTLGSMQEYGKHQVENYGCENGYAEYDSKGKLIRKFKHNISDVSCVEKNDFKKFWYQ